MKYRVSAGIKACSTISLWLSVAACNGFGDSASVIADAQGKNTTPDISAIPPTAAKPVETPDSKTAVTCRSDDPNRICLALRYVVYRDSTGQPTLTEAEVQANVAQINADWKECNVAFQVDEYLAVNPADYGLNYQPGEYSELTDIRTAFAAHDTLLIASTGTWNRNGSMGSTGANAWTTMPGAGPYGVVLEKPVNQVTNMIAHELGHYLNLDHVSDNYSMMNPIIYSYSLNLSPSECETARSAAQTYWQSMMR